MRFQISSLTTTSKLLISHRRHSEKALLLSMISTNSLSKVQMNRNTTWRLRKKLCTAHCSRRLPQKISSTSSPKCCRFWELWASHNEWSSLRSYQRKLTAENHWHSTRWVEFILHMVCKLIKPQQWHSVKINFGSTSEILCSFETLWWKVGDFRFFYRLLLFLFSSTSRACACASSYKLIHQNKLIELKALDESKIDELNKSTD